MTKNLTLDMRSAGMTTKESASLCTSAYAGIKTSCPGFVRYVLRYVILYLAFSVYFLNAHAQNINCAWAFNIGGTIGDAAAGLAMDGAGNVYVTGTYQGAVDFDPGTGIATLTAAGDFDVFLAKYDPNGNYLWARSLGGTAYDEGLAVCVDREGNVYVTGNFTSTDFDAGPGTATLQSVGANDIFVAKYDASGNYRWAVSMGGDGIDYGTALAADAAGNVYVTGYFGVAGTSADFDPGSGSAVITKSGSAQFWDAGMFVARYDTSGNYIWAKSVSGSGDVQGRGIAVDDMANVYVTGSFQQAADFDPGTGTVMLTAHGFNDAYITRYDSSGNFRWAINVGSNDNDFAFGVAVDDTGNVYIAGCFTGTVDFDPAAANTAMLTAIGEQDVFVAKYDFNGNYQWASGMGGSDFDWGRAVALDRSNNVYVTGAFFYGPVDFYPGANIPALPTASGQNVFITKYHADGTYLWAKSIGGSIDDQGYNSTDFGYGVVVGDGVYLTGTFNSLDFDPGPGAGTLVSAGGNDAFVMKLVCTDTSSSHITASIKCGMSYMLNGKSYSTGGTYKQYFGNAAGCDSIVFLELTVIPVDTPVLTVNGNELGVVGTFLAYQWIKGGTDIPGATNATYTVTENNSYQVRVTDAQGCEGISAIYDVTNISVDEYNRLNQYVSVYPNPVRDLIYINSPVNVNAHLSGIDGRTVLDVENAKVISVNGLENGVYLLHIEDKEGRLIKVEKIIKR